VLPRAEPRVRRIKKPRLFDPEYARAAGHPKIAALLQDLWGTVRFDTGKLNMESAGYGAPVEWHQDWAFYPHTNGGGIMLDDCTLERSDAGDARQPSGADLRSSCS
jgi:phytanoyl-CoA hydroxylase